MAKDKNMFRRRGISLVELMVVASILAVIMGLLLPAVQFARSTARRISCQNKMRQIGTAIHMHADTFQALPSGTNLSGNRRYLSWCVPLLPFLEQQNEFSLAEEGVSQSNNVFDVLKHPLLQQSNVAFGCSEDPRVNLPAYAVNSLKLVGLLSYLGCAGTNYKQRDGVIFAGSSIRWKQISDGLSNTLLVGERPPSQGNDFGWWYAGVGYATQAPTDARAVGILDHSLGTRELAISPFGDCDSGDNYFHLPSNLRDECSAGYYWSLHRGGANFLLCDGSTHFISYTVSPEVMDKLGTRAGGDIAISEM